MLDQRAPWRFTRRDGVDRVGAVLTEADSSARVVALARAGEQKDRGSQD
jgi:hypothetical protein